MLHSHSFLCPQVHRLIHRQRHEPSLLFRGQHSDRTLLAVDERHTAISTVDPPAQDLAFSTQGGRRDGRATTQDVWVCRPSSRCFGASRVCRHDSGLMGAPANYRVSLAAVRGPARKNDPLPSTMMFSLYLACSACWCSNEHRHLVQRHTTLGVLEVSSYDAISTCRSRSTNSPFSSTAFSLNSSTLIPRATDRPLRPDRLESAYICRDNNPSLSSSSLNRWNISPKPSLPTRSMK